ncbi:hypothetical protein BDK51DRAFT_46649, partial [Blyttiomyces helicus]
MLTVPLFPGGRSGALGLGLGVTIGLGFALWARPPLRLHCSEARTPPPPPPALAAADPAAATASSPVPSPLQTRKNLVTTAPPSDSPTSPTAPQDPAPAPAPESPPLHSPPADSPSPTSPPCSACTCCVRCLSKKLTAATQTTGSNTTSCRRHPSPSKRGSSASHPHLHPYPQPPEPCSLLPPAIMQLPMSPAASPLSCPGPRSAMHSSRHAAALNDVCATGSAPSLTRGSTASTPESSPATSVSSSCDGTFDAVNAVQAGSGDAAAGVQPISMDPVKLFALLAASRAQIKRLEASLKVLSRKRDSLVESAKVLKKDVWKEREARFVVEKCLGETIKKMELEMDLKDNEILELRDSQREAEDNEYFPRTTSIASSSCGPLGSRSAPTIFSSSYSNPCRLTDDDLFPESTESSDSPTAALDELSDTEDDDDDSDDASDDRGSTPLASAPK